MIKSMTGYARASSEKGGIAVEVTLCSYNSQYLDTVLFLPESCHEFEEEIKKIIARKHRRGRVETRFSILDRSEDSDFFEVDEKKAVSYYNSLKKIRSDFNLSGEISLDNILSAGNLIVPAGREIDQDTLRKLVSETVESASEGLDLMRRKEGENLFIDLIARMDSIEEGLKLIEKGAGEIPEIYKKKLMERISYLLSESEELDMIRISQEAAVIASRSDISEEIVRLRSHVRQFVDILHSDDSQGKKLNFLIQEFSRELNTIGSKARNASLIYMVVDIKSELDKIREQVQNIE